MCIGHNTQAVAIRKLGDEWLEGIEVTISRLHSAMVNKWRQDAIADVRCKSSLKEAAANVVHVIFVEGVFGLRFQSV
jgi:hypothetical protein